MISIKIECIFIISKKLKTKKKKSDHPVNRGLARSDYGLIRFGSKKFEFKRIEKTKDLILKFFRLNEPIHISSTRLTTLSSSVVDSIKICCDQS